MNAKTGVRVPWPGRPGTYTGLIIYSPSGIMSLHQVWIGGEAKQVSWNALRILRPALERASVAAIWLAPLIIHKSRKMMILLISVAVSGSLACEAAMERLVWGSLAANRRRLVGWARSRQLFFTVAQSTDDQRKGGR